MKAWRDILARSTFKHSAMPSGRLNELTPPTRLNGEPIRAERVSSVIKQRERESVSGRPWPLYNYFGCLGMPHSLSTTSTLAFLARCNLKQRAEQTRDSLHPFTLSPFYAFWDEAPGVASFSMSDHPSHPPGAESDESFAEALVARAGPDPPGEAAPLLPAV